LRQLGGHRLITHPHQAPGSPYSLRASHRQCGADRALDSGLAGALEQWLVVGNVLGGLVADGEPCLERRAGCGAQRPATEPPEGVSGRPVPTRPAPTPPASVGEPSPIL